jgi:hypothetical protein
VAVVEHTGQEASVASHTLDPHAPVGPGSPTFNRSYLMAATRAAVIALFLLAVLALIVLF